jgi:hypothetical protein
MNDWAQKLSTILQSYHPKDIQAFLLLSYRVEIDLAFLKQRGRADL